MPIIADRLRLIWKLMTSKLKPIGPVKFLISGERPGKIPTKSTPITTPRIAPIIIKAMKNPMCPLSKVIKYYQTIEYIV
jgi:hypothetical protein